MLRSPHSSLISFIKITGFFSPHLPSPISSHYPSLQHHQAFTGNILPRQARETVKPTEDIYNSLLSSKHGPPASSLSLLQSTSCSLQPGHLFNTTCGSHTPSSPYFAPLICLFIPDPNLSRYPCSSTGHVCHTLINYAASKSNLLSLFLRSSSHSHTQLCRRTVVAVFHVPLTLSPLNPTVFPFKPSSLALMISSSPPQQAPVVYSPNHSGQDNKEADRKSTPLLFLQM